MILEVFTWVLSGLNSNIGTEVYVYLPAIIDLVITDYVAGYEF